MTAGASDLLGRIRAFSQSEPESPAVEDRQGVLAYGDLEALAGAVGAHLIRQGVEVGDRVAICVERSRFVPVAVLGALVAGAAYVPIDPSHPPARIRLVLEQADVRTVVASRSLEPLVRDLAPSRVTVLEEAVRSRPDPPAQAPAADPDRPLYVIFTSGSTGRPKGVVMPQRAIVNLLAWQWRTARRPLAGRTAQFSALSFDVAAQELFFTLGSGGTLVSIDDKTRRDPLLLLRRLCDDRVDRLFLPFAALQQLALEGVSRSVHPPLREVITAGEQLIVTPAIRAWFSRLPGTVLRNQYGPTETHVVTELALPDDVDAWPERPSIGGPIDRVEVTPRDDELGPVQVGEVGELCVQGPCLASGYLGQPALTAERFPTVRGGRLYRTGDLGRVLSDGTIAFLGRRDDQVKIRGVRLELGECDAALAMHPDVAEAAAAVDERDGHKRLLAFYVPRGELAAKPAATASAELRAWMAELVPEHAVPHSFTALDVLPTTPTGKIDRAAMLSRISPPKPSSALIGEPGGSGLERDVLAAMGDVLGTAVGAGDDFFERGGDSLSATRLAHRLWDVSGSEVTVTDVFETRTARRLARLLARRAGATERALDVPVEPDDDDPVPASHSQRRFWIAEVRSPGDVTNLAPVIVDVAEPLDVAALEAALRDVVERQHALREAFVDHGVAIVQQVVAAPSTSLVAEHDYAEPASLLSAANERLDPLQGRPVSAVVAPRGFGCRVVLALHHICTDGESERLLLDELAAAYHGRALDPPAASIRAYSVWHSQLLAGRREAQLDYWRRQLHQLAPPPVAAPGNEPLRATELSVEARVVAALDQQARKRGTTPFAMLLTAYVTALRVAFQQWDVTVTTPVAGRRHPAFARTLGCFINTVAIRPALQPSMTTGESAHAVSRCLRDALAHQDVPFDDVIAEVYPNVSTRPHNYPHFTVDEFDVHDFVGHPARRIDAWHPGGPVGSIQLALRPGRSPGALQATLFDRGLPDALSRKLAGAFDHTAKLLASGSEVRLDHLGAREKGGERVPSATR
jgi:amino acid adenylation domain-containing protein